nr:amino acid permease 8-like [Populus alba]
MEMTMDAGDDGRVRTGTLWTATAHAFTAVVGAGILALPWSVAQLGWILGPFVLVFFAIVTYYIASLLCDCYRTPDPVTGKRNYTYIYAVRELLGPRSELICGILQYSILWGTMIGYTVTTAISIAAVKRSTCFHDKGHNAKCGVSGNLYMLIYGAIEIFLSQCPNLEKVAILSVIAAVTSFAYALIALCLSTAKLSSNHEFKGSLMVAMVGNTEATSERFWQAFQALGNIALAYTYCMLLLEIQDTLKSVPAENKVMKRVSLYVVVGTAFFYISLGCIGYAAFGNDVPGNILSGFYEPFWLVDMANIAVIIHLIGAYQVYAQPVFAINEKWIGSRWPTSSFNKIYTIRFPCSRKGSLHLSMNRLFLRTIFVVITTAVAMMFPFFNAILGLLGSVSFWPLTVYFPISMYIVQAKIKRGSYHWFGLQALGFVCLIVTVVSGIGSVAGMVEFLKKARLFHIEM